MLASFKKLNEKKDEKHTRIPQELLQLLNMDLPDDLEYISYDDGMCAVQPIGNKNNTISMKVTLPETAQKYKDVIKTSEDLAEYSYRTQQKLKLSPYEDNTIIMNGHRIAVDKLITFPLDGGKTLKDNVFVMAPPPFNKIPPIVLKAGKVELEFQVERKPYDSMNETLIQLSYKDMIIIDAILDEKTLNSKWTIHLNTENKSAKELYDMFVFYNAFGKGNIKYKNQKFTTPTKKDVIYVDETNIELLRKIIKIEEKLNVEFEIPNQFTYKEFEIVEQLYRSLISKKAFKHIAPFNELTCTGTPPDENAIEKTINSSLMLTGCDEKTIDVFGIKFKLFLLQALFNLFVLDVKVCDENTTKFKIDDTNKKMFACYRYFPDEESVIRYQKNNKKWVEKFKEAETIE